MTAMKKQAVAALLLALCLMTGCADKSAQTEPATETQPATQTEAQPATQPEPAQPEAPAKPDTASVADASQTAAATDVGWEGMAAVPASALNDGTYPVAVDCSSTMFKIASCDLRVEGGRLYADMTLGSDAYGYLFAGTAADAAGADESQYLTATERRFTLPIDALDDPVSCAAWSVKKELWYDRTLIFRSDSLPLDAFREVVTAETLGLLDGAYLCDVSLSGGSGRASVQSPARLTVAGGAVTAKVIWSSANYDYMLVGGTRYDAEIADGHSQFTIPVAAFDRALGVVADTTAMSQPYEIDYTLTFDAATLARET